MKKPEDGIYFVELFNDSFTYRCELIGGQWYFADGTGWKAKMENPESIVTATSAGFLPDLPKTKPPLGTVSRRVWEQDRQLNLLAAMARYLEEDFKIPPEWIEELTELNERNE